MVNFKLSSFLIGVVLFSVIVMALAIPYGDLATNYNVKVDASFNETYAKLDIVDNSTLDIGKEIRGKEDLSAVDAFFLAGRAILSSARIVFNSFGVVTSIAFNVATDIGIPPLFVTAFTTILLISIVFGIISLWARFRT